MNQLYPIKFEAIFKEKIWGGDKLKTVLKKQVPDISNCGESWEISAIQDNISVVANGFLKGNTLEEIIEIYMGDIVGEKVFDKFGLEFPLLIKFIDANADLSIQVHPDDKTAKERHKAYGKTEMWYVVQADDGAEIITGFHKKISKKIYLDNLKQKSLKNILKFEKVKAGDVFFIPAGRVHSIGKGVLLAEIQQTSDITYRIYDYDRIDSDGKKRELHTDLAIDVIDYNFDGETKLSYKIKNDETVKLVSCDYFNTNILQFSSVIIKDYTLIDSFIIYMCVGGSFSIDYGGKETVEMNIGETVLLPADLDNIKLIPTVEAKLIEVFIKGSSLK